MGPISTTRATSTTPPSPDHPAGRHSPGRRPSHAPSGPHSSKPPCGSDHHVRSTTLASLGR